MDVFYLWLMICIAILPGAALLLYVFFRDRVEKEPIGLILLLLLMGGLSILPAIIGEMLGDAVLSLLVYEGSTLFAFLECFFVVAIVEEGVKFLFAKWVTWKNKNFNFSFDGIVYCVCTSVGFAIVENIMYVLEGGMNLAFTRALTAIVAHTTFGVIMGLYYGRAKQYESLGNFAKKRKCLWTAYLIPVGLHGLYDFCLSTEYVILFLLFYVVLIGLYIVMFLTVKNASKKDAPAVAMDITQFYR